MSKQQTETYKKIAWVQTHDNISDKRCVKSEKTQKEQVHRVFVETAGHGYLLIPHKDLQTLTADYTHCSFMHGQFYALEEDVDMRRYMEAIYPRQLVAHRTYQYDL